MHGHVPSGQAITRAGAQPGDRVYVTGSLGGASLALADPGIESWGLGDLTDETALRLYWMPAPRFAFAQALRGIATAAIDISDGLSSDLVHLCRASGVACRVDLAQLPTFAGCAALAAATSGDDYELAFTAPTVAGDRIASLADQAGVATQQIGTIQRGATQATSTGCTTALPSRCRGAIAISDRGTLKPGDLRDPLALLATGFGTGLSPYAPGTAGSVLAVLIWWFAIAELPLVARVAVALVAFGLGVVIVERVVRRLELGDAPAIVWDEIAGCWLALAIVPKSWPWGRRRFRPVPGRRHRKAVAGVLGGSIR